MTAATPQQIVESALAQSRTDGCVVLVRVTSEANVRWARNTLTTNGATSESSVSVIAVVGTDEQAAAGSKSGSGLELEAVPDLVGAARAVAEHAGPSPDARPLITGVPVSTDWDEPPGRTSATVFAALTPDLGEVFRAAQADGYEHFGFASHSTTTTYLGTSTGLRLRHVQPEGRFEMTAKSHARTRSAWVGAATRDFADVDPAAHDAELRSRLDWQARTVEVPAGRHAALLTPSAVSDLMIELYWSAVGRDAAEGRSVFSSPAGGTRLGERLGPETLQLHSDPSMPGLQCSPFVVAAGSSAASSVFDNGMPLGSTGWVRDGRLAGLITTRATAEEHRLPLRPEVDNLALEVTGGAGSLADVLARTDRALMVSCLWYNRVVDPQTLLLTGLTRDGVYVVEGGEVVGAATNFRFNDSPVSMLHRITDAGTSAPTLAREMGDYFNRCAMAPLVVADFNFSTVSQAS